MISDPLKDEESPLYVWHIIRTYQKLFENHEELECDDTDLKKLSPTILNTLSLLSSFIPPEITGSSKEVFNIFLRNFEYRSAIGADALQLCALKIKLVVVSYYILSIYRPPSGDMMIFLHTLEYISFIIVLLFLIYYSCVEILILTI